MRTIVLAFALLFLIVSQINEAYAACPQQTLTFSLTTTNGTATATKCISNADITSLQAAISAQLVANGVVSPTGAQEWAQAVAIMSQALNNQVSLLMQSQQTPAFTGAQ